MRYEEIPALRSNYVSPMGIKLRQMFPLQKDKHNKTVWEAMWECHCGRLFIGDVQGVYKGKIKSCGCLRKRPPKHGQSYKPIYYIWLKMKAACNNPNDRRYYLIGANGIGYYEEWEDFSAFYEWAESSMTETNKYLCRKDINGDFTPNNCYFDSKFQRLTNKGD